jgi:Flp pilus assembly pilin Flp
MTVSLFRRFWADDEGQDLVEYALLATFVSLASVVAVAHLGDVVGDVFDSIADELEDGGNP